MASSFKLSIVAPDRTVFEDMVTAVVAPGHEGYLGVLAHHEPMIVALRTGILEYVDMDDQRNHVWIGGGFLEVSQNEVIVLAEGAERSTDIDVERAQKALDEARRALRGEVSGVTREAAASELERAMTRIKVARTQ